MTPRLIVFDVDGTLVDSQAHILASMAGAFAAVGRPMPPRAEALSVVGLSLSLALARLVPGASAAEVDAMTEAYKAAFQHIRQTGEGASPLFPGTREMLDRLAGQEGVVLGLATGKSRRGLDHLIALHDLGRYFVTQQVADDHPSKPHPSMIRAALDETGASAAGAAMIGDTVFDIDMGRAAGVRTVGVRWGYHRPEMLAGADALIDSWADLPAALVLAEPAP
ncbi:MAG: HAD-IA family hydrolase [Rhodobacteraceae bacterium]|jgi:phosphoglycolate phosphatase|nr:HAD-IA family hydrolase [Paracoccaceae bacterium]